MMNMKTNNILLNYNNVPKTWHLCFQNACPRREECLRYAVGRIVPEEVVCGPTVFPSAVQKGQCRLYLSKEPVRCAYGFDGLFQEVRVCDAIALRAKTKEYLGGNGTYYRYQHGERLLTPEQQRWILELFASYGYKDLEFDHYVHSVVFW